MRTDNIRESQSIAKSDRPVTTHPFSFQVRAMGGLPGSTGWNKRAPHREV